jgi:hypothetical protein
MKLSAKRILNVAWSYGGMTDVFKDLERKKEAMIELSYFS